MGKLRRGDSISPPVTTRSSGANVNGKTERTKRLPEGDKAAGIAFCEVCVCSAWMFPVVKAEYAGLFGTATKEEDDGEDEQADHHDDFGAGEPELGLAVELDGEELRPTMTMIMMVIQTAMLISFGQ